MQLMSNVRHLWRLLVQVVGVGTFCEHPGYWESYPERLNGAVLSIESNDISVEQQELSRYICSNWEEVLALSLNYIESHRENYGLQAKTFKDPGVFIQSGEEWSIYFDTNNEYEAVVGIEFRGIQPFQMIIGD
jgi:hypothetical protein